MSAKAKTIGLVVLEVLSAISIGAVVWLVLSATTGCGMLSAWFEPGADPDGAGPQLPPPSHNDTAAALASTVGGPYGVIIAQALTAANAVWNVVRALPAVQRRRHAKYSSKRVTP